VGDVQAVESQAFRGGEQIGESVDAESEFFEVD